MGAVDFSLNRWNTVLMQLPKELTTVTSISKVLAVVVFLTLPFIAFFSGVRYQEMMQIVHETDTSEDLTIKPPQTSSLNKTRNVRPILAYTNITSHWKEYNIKEIDLSFKLPPELLPENEKDKNMIVYTKLLQSFKFSK